MSPQLWRLSAAPLGTRSRNVRHIWDLRWHGDNQAVANPRLDPALTCCPHCHGRYTQTHILCDCPHLTPERSEVLHTLHLAAFRYRADGCQTLALAYIRFGQLWTGLWPPAQRDALRPYLALCSLANSKLVLRELGRLTVSAVSHIWDRHLETLHDSEPYPEPSIRGLHTARPDLLASSPSPASPVSGDSPVAPPPLQRGAPPLRTLPVASASLPPCPLPPCARRGE